MSSQKTIRPYTLIEEICSCSVHGLGIILSIAGLVVLTTFAGIRGNVWAIVSTAIFGVSMIILYTASTLYHAITNPNAKQILKRFDHIAIYYLIAGSYTPFMLVNLRGGIGWTIFGVIWGLTLLGTILKLVLPPTGTKVWSVLLYLIMGWMVIIALKPLVQSLPHLGLVFLILGGVFYTLGIPFYIWKSQKYTHAIWHGFVLTGTIMHFFAVLYGCVLV